MKVLLRNAQTGMYYRDNAAWVAQEQEAVNFETLQRAGQKARELDWVDVVLSYENPDQKVALNPAYCL